MKSLRTKTLVYLLSLLLVVGLVTYFAGTRLVDQSLNTYEEHVAAERLARVAQGMELSLSTLATSATDYAHWDPTYAFMLGTDPEFLTREFFRSNLDNLHLTYVLMLDQDGRLRGVVDGSAPALVTGGPERKDFDALIQDFQDAGIRMKLASRQGYLLRIFNGQPIALAFADIEPSEPGPDDTRVGWLIMARKLDDGGLTDLRKLTGAHIEAHAVGASTNTMAGKMRFVLQDALGTSPVEATIDRPLSLENQRAIVHKMLAYTLVIMAVLAGVLTLVIMERLVLCRLGLFSQLALDDQKLDADGTHTTLWPVRGSDELDTLAVSLNQLVASLTAAQVRMRNDQNILLDAKQQLEFTNRLKDSFLATISHELRTPMNGIIGAEELLKASQPTAYQKECLDALGDASHMMLSMVERILLFSELQSGNALPKPQIIGLQEWVSLVQRFWVTIFTHCPAKFSMECEPFAQPWIAVDTVKVDQLVQELLRNAAKFTTQGEVSLHMRQAHENGRYWLILDIRDSGIGIPQEQLDKVMDAFGGGKSRYRRNYGGLGIGLAISRAIVQVLGAEWTIESSTSGTRVLVHIPVEKAEAPVQPAPRPVTDDSSLRDLRQAPGRILLVEDNPVNQKIMKKILEMLGWPYQLAENGLEAVGWAEKEAFAMILMDCQMPVMDGLEATKVIRQSKNPNQFTPIIAITANVSDLDRDNCMSVGMNAYLPKPVKPQQIHDAIHNWMAQGTDKAG